MEGWLGDEIAEDGGFLGSGSLGGGSLGGGFLGGGMEVEGGAENGGEGELGLHLGIKGALYVGEFGRGRASRVKI